MLSIASVHRFGDKVAVYVGHSETTYLTAKQARALARTLQECARDIVNNAFVRSTFEGRDLEYVGATEAKEEVQRFPRNRP